MRVATFSVENLDEDIFDAEGELRGPSLALRLDILRPQLTRLDADIICFQEVHGQETEGEPRALLTLKEFLEGTPYELFHVEHTKTSANEAYDKRNLVIVSRFPVDSIDQLRNDKVPQHCR